VNGSFDDNNSIIPHEGIGLPQLWAAEDGGFLDTQGLYWGAAARELVLAPARKRGQSDSDALSEIRALSSLITLSLAPWRNAGSLEVRYLWDGERTQRRVRLVLVARALGNTLQSGRAWADHMLATATSAFPKEWSFGPLRALVSVEPTTWLEIERLQEVRSPGPFVPSNLAAYYYLVHPLAGDGSGWLRLSELLREASTPGFLSIAMMPTALTNVERQAVDRVCTLSQHLSESQQGYDFFGNQRSTPADASARDVLNAWNSFRSPNGFLIRIGVAAPREHIERTTASIAALLSSAHRLEEGKLAPSYHIVRGLDDWQAFQTVSLGLVCPRYDHAIWKHDSKDAPVTLERLTYFFTEDEASRLFALPVPDEYGVSGFNRSPESASRRSTADLDAVAEPSVTIGNFLDHEDNATPAQVPLRALNRHALVVGTPGYGKTTAVHTLLASLWNDHHVPWAVIEPTRPEYRGLISVAGLEALKVYSLGREDISPLRVNPMQPPPGVRCETHQSALNSIFRLALPLPPPLPQLLRQAIERCYLLAGWDYHTTTADDIPAPGLRDLLQAFNECFEEANYTGEPRNISAAFGVRLRSLLSGSRGLLLDTCTSSDFDRILSSPCIFELGALEDNDDKALLAALILHQVRSRAIRQGSSGGALRHVTVVEEAHRILPSEAREASESGEGTRARAAEEFTNAIAELRSTGEGFILCSQQPSRLTPAAVGNTNTRLMFQLTNSADRQKMLEDVAGTTLDADIASSLPTGVCIARWLPMARPEVIRVVPSPGVDTSVVPSDEVVAIHMRRDADANRRVRPYALCSAVICSHGCNPRTRTMAHSVELRARGAVRHDEVWSGEATFEEYCTVLAAILKRQGVEDSQLLYCSVLHSAMERPQHGYLGFSNALVAARIGLLERIVRAARGGL